MSSRPGVPATGASKLSRRGLLLGAAGAAAAGLSACATGGGTPQSRAKSAPGFPVTIANKYGRSTIETAPQRIVTLGITDHDVALPLGVVPEGLYQWGPWSSGVGPWVEQMLRDEQPKLFGSDYTAESVVALAPQAITAVQSALTSEMYNRLGKFAPVVAQPPNSIDYGVAWRQQAETIGKALGKPEETAELIAGTQDKIERTRRENPVFEGRTHVTVRTDSKGTYAAYTAQDARTHLLEQLGLRLSPSIRELGNGEEFNVKVSKENVGMLDADVVLVTTAKPTDIQAVRNDPLLNNLPAAKRGGLVVLDDYDLTMALGSSTVSSIPFVLDRIAPMLAKALG